MEEKSSFYFIMVSEQHVNHANGYLQKEINNMSYDPNFPFGYTPYYQQRQNTYAFVNGIEGAKSYIVQPNQTILLMDSDAPMCYMKQSNGLGQSTLRYFKLVEVKEDDLKTPQNDDIASLKQRLEALEKKLEGKKSNE